MHEIWRNSWKSLIVKLLILMWGWVSVSLLQTWTYWVMTNWFSFTNCKRRPQNHIHNEGYPPIMILCWHCYLTSYMRDLNPVLLSHSKILIPLYTVDTGTRPKCPDYQWFTSRGRGVIIIICILLPSSVHFAMQYYHHQHLPPPQTMQSVLSSLACVLPPSSHNVHYSYL